MGRFLTSISFLRLLVCQFYVSEIAPFLVLINVVSASKKLFLHKIYRRKGPRLWSRNGMVLPLLKPSLRGGRTIPLEPFSNLLRFSALLLKINNVGQMNT